jgi:hypothetical protein
MEGTVIFSKEFIKQKRNKKEKLLLVASYLKLNSPLNGNVGVSINLLAEKIGYKPDSHENKINDKIKTSFKSLISSNDIFIDSRLSWSKKTKWQQRDVAVDDLTAAECILIHINEDSKLFYPDDQYVVLTEAEFITIVQSCVKTDREDILNTYLNIKKFMNFDKDSKQLCYPSHTTLCKDCNISSTGAMNNIIKDLIGMGLLYTYNSGRYTDKNGNIKFSNNFYALDGKTLNAEICDDLIKGYYSTSQGVLIDNFIKGEN